MTVIPSQKEQSEEGINKISPSEKSRLLSLLHLGHFSTVYANIVSSFEKIKTDIFMIYLEGQN